MPRDGALDGASVSVRGLRLTRDGKRILDIDRLDIPTNGTTAIIGPNGSGKTTLLRVLHGLAAPDAGRIDWPGAAAPVQAMLLQHPVLLRRSAAGNIAFALRRAGVSRADRPGRIDGLLSDARLAELADRPARRLSGGQQRRLALARALAVDPAMLLLDEPAAGLDPAAMRRLERMIADSAARGIAVLLTSHDLGQVRRLADWLVFMHAGRVVEAGRTDTLLDNPGTQELATFLRGDLLW